MLSVRVDGNIVLDGFPYRAKGLSGDLKIEEAQIDKQATSGWRAIGHFLTSSYGSPTYLKWEVLEALRSLCVSEAGGCMDRVAFSLILEYGITMSEHLEYLSFLLKHGLWSYCSLRGSYLLDMHVRSLRRQSYSPIG